MATITDPKLVSNKVFKSLQPSETYKPHTGTVLYANKYADVAEVSMPDDIKSVLDSDAGTVGNNPIIQLKGKLKVLDGGPWYVDCRNGMLYIHNRKFNEDSVHTYVYQSENGEVINVSFETERVTKQVGGSIGMGVDPYTGGLISSTSDFSSDVPGPGSVQNQPRQPKRKPTTQGLTVRSVERNYSTRVARRPVLKRRKKNPKIQRQRNATERAYSTYKNTYKGNRQAYMNAQAKALQNAQSNATKDKYAISIIKGLSAYDQADLTNRAREAYNKSGGKRAAVWAVVRQFFNRGDSHVVYSKIWTTEWVDPTKYTGNNTFKGAGTGRHATRKGAEAHKVKDTKFSLDRMRQDPSIKIISGVYISEDRSSFFGRYSYRVQILRQKWVKGRINKIAYVTDWVCRICGGNRGNGGANGNGYGGIHIGIGGPGVGGFGGSYAGNYGRTVTEKKLVVSMQVIGRPSLETSQIITIGNVGEKWSGDYYIKTCTHQIDSSNGYTCSLDLNSNGEKSGSTTNDESIDTNKIIKDNARGNDKNTERGLDVTTTKPVQPKKGHYKQEKYERRTRNTGHSNRRRKRSSHKR